MYKCEQRYINEILLTRNARARTHTRHVFGYSQELITKISSFAFSPHIQMASDQGLQCQFIGISIKDLKMNYYTRRHLK